MPAALRTLYVCYLSLDDPLVHTQVVAYLEGLASSGHTVHLMTFEPPVDAHRKAAITADLGRRGITWHARRYHKRPSLPATVYDVLTGALACARLMRRHRLGVFHARSHVPAVMGLIVRRLTGCRFIFDLRGLMAEEYADAGRWKAGGLPFRITKRAERASIAAADGMVVLTRRVRDHLFGGRPSLPLEVIPCCADLDAISAESVGAAAVRAQLGAGERPILLYVGKFTGWYMEDEMVEFYAAAREEIPELLFVILTQADHAPAVAALERHGIEPGDYRITSARPYEMGRYLAAADVGIALIRPCFSKISSSPTKIGEYLGGGLPVVSGPGIGDVDALLATDAVGVLLPAFGPEDLHAGARALAELVADPDTGRRCRAVAERELSLTGVGIPRYERLYQQVAAAA